MKSEKIVLNLYLEEDEFIKVDGCLFTTRESLMREEPKVYLIGKKCLKMLKEFEENLTFKIVNEWMLLSRAMDQTCGFETSWDDRKILSELVKGLDHPVSWYVKNCKLAS
jgi:hypothetical protein